MSTLRLILLTSLFPFLLSPIPSQLQSAPTEKEVLAAMKRATGFMMNSVSNRGGFLWYYSEDLSKVWGETPARKTQIWVQPPGTPAVGLLLLEGYEATHDAQYLTYAEKVAGALIWGQLPSGGWNYLIDFDPKGLDEWYEQVASKCIGWEEFYHFNGNATFDDDTTASATRFLLRLYGKTQDPKHRPALHRALNFILQAQYPNGGWPQRYPLSHDFPHGGHPDYTSFYTFNDDVISNNIYLLLEAYERFGNEEYRQAARRGMDFYILSQRPRPQAGWAQQYDMDLNPAWARSYEPPALMTRQTIENIGELEKFYLITGDRRHLEPISGAIQWLKDSVINKDPSKNFTHAIYYEPATNQAIYPHDEHRKNAAGKFEIVGFYVDKNPDKEPGRPLYSSLPRVDIPSVEKEFKRISSLKPEEGKRDYEAQKERTSTPAAEEIKKLISSLDARGAWITDIEFLDTLDWIHNPPTRFRGIDVEIYISRMDKLIRYLKTARKG